MARQLSGDQQNLRVGISSFSEDKTSLVVVGKVGINTDEAMQALHVEGNAYISGSIGIGTSTPSDAVDPSNTTVLNVGIVTANELYGEGKELTGIITSAYNLSGGDDGKLVIQSAPGVTSYFDYGNTGFALISRGSGNPPQWSAAAPAGAIEGLLLFEEGAVVGGGNSYGGLDFRGSAITVVGAGTPANIGTVFVSGDFDGGVNITGGGFTMSIGGSTVAGIDTFGNLSVGAALTVAGLSTFHNSISVGGSIFPLPGMALTYYGDGSNLQGAGVWQSTDVGINTISNVGIATTNPVSALQVGSASSSFNVVSTASSIQVGIGTTSPDYTLEVVGDANIQGELKIEGSKVGTIAMIVALGGF